MDSIVQGVARSRTRLSDFHFHFQVALGICEFSFGKTLTVFLFIVGLKMFRFIQCNHWVEKRCVNLSDNKLSSGTDYAVYSTSLLVTEIVTVLLGAQDNNFSP